MKRLMILVAMLAVALALQLSPAFAQDSGSMDQYSGGAVDDSVTLSFELAIQGTPPVDKSFFGYIPAEGGIATQLRDPDGDGVYIDSMDIPQYAPGPRPVPEDMDPVTLPIQIVQATEVKYGVPLYPEVLEDFGQVLMDEDKTFSTTIVFDGPAEPNSPTPGPDDSTTDSLGNIEVLPDTGGTLVPVLGTVALLAGGGFLFASLRLMGFLRRH